MPKFTREFLYSTADGLEFDDLRAADADLAEHLETETQAFVAAADELRRSGRFTDPAAEIRKLAEKKVEELAKLEQEGPIFRTLRTERTGADSALWTPFHAFEPKGMSEVREAQIQAEFQVMVSAADRFEHKTLLEGAARAGPVGIVALRGLLQVNPLYELVDQKALESAATLAARQLSPDAGKRLDQVDLTLEAMRLNVQFARQRVMELAGIENDGSMPAIEGGEAA